MCAECERLRREISAGFSRQRSECCVEQVWDLWLDSGVVCVINEPEVQKRKEGGRKGSASVSLRPRPPRPAVFRLSIHPSRRETSKGGGGLRRRLRDGNAESEPNCRRKTVCTVSKNRKSLSKIQGDHSGNVKSLVYIKTKVLF